MGIVIGGVLSLLGGSFFVWWGAATACVLLYQCAPEDAAPPLPVGSPLPQARPAWIDDMQRNKDLEVSE